MGDKIEKDRCKDCQDCENLTKCLQATIQNIANLAQIMEVMLESNERINTMIKGYMKKTMEDTKKNKEFDKFYT